MAQLPTTLGDLAAPTPSRSIASYTPQSGPSLAPLEASGNAITKSAEDEAGALAGVGQAISGGAASITDQQTKDALVDAADRENQYNAKVRDYLYNPDTGIMNLKGKDAIGVSKQTEQFLTEARNQTMDGVTNPVAIKSLGNSLSSATNTSMEATDRFESLQKTSFHGQVYDNTMANSQNSVAAQPYDDKAFASNLNTAISAAEQKTRLTMGQTATTQDLLDAHTTAASAMWSTRIQTALNSGDPSLIARAGQWYDQAKGAGQINFKDDETLGHTLKAVVPAANANVFFKQNQNVDLTNTADTTTLYNAGQVGSPGNSDQTALLAGVAQQESGGKDFNPDGTLITSPAGAQGKMQVMPGTNMDPGFGVAPAKDDSPEERNRVGQEYLAAMQTRYGDNRLALAAYNAGPGTVDKAIEKCGRDNVSQILATLPAETQAYVPKVLANCAQYQAQNGQTVPPETIQANAANLPADQRSYYVAAATDANNAITQQYATGRNSAIDDLQVALANNNGSINNLDPKIVATGIKYNVWGSLSQSKGFSDPAMVNRLETLNTDQLTNFDLTDPNVRMRLSAADMQKFEKRQSDILSDPKNAIISRKIDDAVKYTFGSDQVINATTGQPYTSDEFAEISRRTENPDGRNADALNKNDYKAFDQVARFKDLLGSQVRAEYEQTKKPPTDNDIQAMADRLIMNRQVSPAVPNQIVTGTQNAHWYDHTQIPVTKPLMDLTVEDIPSDKRSVIEQGLRKIGRPINNSNVISAYYATLKRNPQSGNLESTAQVPTQTGGQ